MKVLPVIALLSCITFTACASNSNDSLVSGIPDQIELIRQRYTPEVNECYARNVQMIWAGMDSENLRAFCWQEVLERHGYK